MEYRSINMYLVPIESDVSQYKIECKCNEMATDGWILVSTQIVDECNIMLIFRR